MSGEVRGRSNGLSAPTYTLLVPVSPADVDGLLSTLATAGVAAYAATTGAEESAAADDSVPGAADAPPLVGAVDVEKAEGGPYGDEGHDSDERLMFVDSSQLRAAREALARTLPDVAAALVQAEEDATFAAIVAGWDTAAPRTWPDAEEVDEAPVRRPDTPAEPPAPPRRRSADAGPPPVRPIAPTPPATPPALVGEPDGGHYVPPPPPPLPRLSPLTLLTVAALMLGIALLIVPTLFGLDHSSGVDLLAIACIIGAVAGLVARMRTTRVDDGPDDGAVV